jgi:hypothetical protein
MSDDPVNHPRHYTSHPSGVACVEVNEHFAANVAAAIKYLWRKDLKTPLPLQDLQKAEWYLARECQRLAYPVDEKTVRERMVAVATADDGLLGRTMITLGATTLPEIYQVLELVRDEIRKTRGQ